MTGEGFEPVMSSENDRSSWDFARLLAWHLNTGTRPDGLPQRWKIADFAEAVGHNEKSVRNWRDGRHCIHPEDVERAFFGSKDKLADRPDLLELRDEMRRAWERSEAQHAKTTKARKNSVPAKADVIERYESWTRKQFADIQSRITNPNDRPTSDSRPKIIG